jgi:hypothetical protein
MKIVPAINFKARGMPVTLLRIGTKAEFTAPGWTRLQKHIEKQEKAGWTVSVRRRRLPNPIEVEGYKCVELADVDLCEPLV